MTDTLAVTTCTDACTVSFVLQPAPVSEERIADLSLMFGAFVLASVVIYFSKQLLRIFEVNQHEE